MGILCREISKSYIRSISLPRLMISNNHLRQVAGSELVTQELVEEFVRRGWQVTIYTNLFMPPMAEEFRELISTGRVHVTGDPYESFDLAAFDLIWIHHSCLPPSMIEQMGQRDFRTPVVWHHMSGATHIELPILSDIETQIADVISAVSEETRAALGNFGLDTSDSRLFLNPAPRNFCEYPLKPPRESPERLAVVSNHVPDELWDAIDRLRGSGIRVDVVGMDGVVTRITPDFLSMYDAVISIGKTVQYALVLGIPVFEYDQFGGIGWITDRNWEEAAFFNFSGRSSGRRLDAVEIAEEVWAGWSSALAFSRSRVGTHREMYGLERTISDLLAAGPITRPRLKQLNASQVARWLAYAEEFRGLYRTLEFYKDQLASAVEISPGTVDTERDSLGVVLMLTSAAPMSIDRAVACVVQQTCRPDVVAVVATAPVLAEPVRERLENAGIKVRCLYAESLSSSDTMRAVNRSIMGLLVGVVAMLDLEVIWHPRYLESVMQAFAGSPDVAAVVAPHHRALAHLVNGEERIDHHSVVLDSSGVTGDPGSLSAVDVLQQRLASYQSLVFRRKAAIACGLFNAKLGAGHGAEFAARLLLQGGIGIVPSDYPLLSLLSTNEDVEKIDEHILMGLLRMRGAEGHGVVALSVLLAQSLASSSTPPVRQISPDVEHRLEALTAEVRSLGQSMSEAVARAAVPVQVSSPAEIAKRRRPIIRRRETREK